MGTYFGYMIVGGILSVVGLVMLLYLVLQYSGASRR